MAERRKAQNILYQVKNFERVSNMKLADLAKSFIFVSQIVDKVIFGIKSKTHIDQLVTDIENIPFIKKGYFRKYNRVIKN